MKNEFEREIRGKLSGLSLQDICCYSWLCAVRALPFLTAKGEIVSWRYKKGMNQVHLLAVFRALDYAASGAAAADDAYAAVDAAATAAAKAATQDAHAATTAARDGARARASTDQAYAAAVTTAAAAVTTAAAAVTTAACAYAVAYAAAAAAAAITSSYVDATYTAAAASSSYVDADADAAFTAIRMLIDIKPVLVDDIERLWAGERCFYSDISMYGELWDSFQAALHDVGCGYWGDWYSRIFDKGLALDDDDIAEIIQRLNAPPEITEQGAAAVADYMRNTEKQGRVRTQRETRLIILGSAGAGKTTLARRLTGDKSYPSPRDSTHGVDTGKELDCNGAKAHIWDFGGQVIYHSSHRCFMSANCVYILVVNARTEENRDIGLIDYWLETIRIYSENTAKVFIVLNESDDRNQRVEDFDALKEGEYDSLIQKIYSFNVGKDRTSLNAFRNELSAYIETVGHQTFGRNDSEAMKKVVRLFKEKEKVLPTDRLAEILQNSGIKTKRDQARVRELFNTLGIALGYDFMKDFILDPYWISHGVYKVIDYLQKKKSLFINYSDLEAVFADERGDYPEGKREYIIKLMEHHRIGFRDKKGIRGLVVPCVAPQFRPRDVPADVDPDNLVTYVERDDLKEFPADFFYRYTGANENDIKDCGKTLAIWQEGMVLEVPGASALVELRRNTRIEITVWGDNKQDYCNRLESLITDLLKEYRFTSYVDTRRKGDKVIKIILLVVEAAAKGATKAFFETGVGSTLK